MKYLSDDGNSALECASPLLLCASDIPLTFCEVRKQAQPSFYLAAAPLV